ncbi:unnamed protein product [Phytophthora fragariaefolia]|uniref:Unnamed protein product n=1 Tax=Phytophthora fragariaefolia TaxID=1490495 RepID=A0A9W6XPN2_9STRA|nr:unnamed protein product [Phytophthora fragariaefolia]
MHPTIDPHGRDRDIRAQDRDSIFQDRENVVVDCHILQAHYANTYVRFWAAVTAMVRNVDLPGPSTFATYSQSTSVTTGLNRPRSTAQRPVPSPSEASESDPQGADTEIAMDTGDRGDTPPSEASESVNHDEDDEAVLLVHLAV